MHAQPGRAHQKLRRITSGLPALSDLQDKFSGPGELEDLAILRHRITDHPHEAFRIDVKAVLVLRPFIRGRLASGWAPTPSLNEIASAVELEHRRCGHRAQIFGKRARPMQNPHVPLRIDRNGRGIAEPPLRRQLQPAALFSKLRNAPFTNVWCIRRPGLSRNAKRCIAPNQRECRRDHCKSIAVRFIVSSRSQLQRLSNFSLLQRY